MQRSLETDKLTWSDIESSPSLLNALNDFYDKQFFYDIFDKARVLHFGNYCLIAFILRIGGSMTNTDIQLALLQKNGDKYDKLCGLSKAQSDSYDAALLACRLLDIEVSPQSIIDSLLTDPKLGPYATFYYDKELSTTYYLGAPLYDPLSFATVFFKKADSVATLSEMISSYDIITEYVASFLSPEVIIEILNAMIDITEPATHIDASIEPRRAALFTRFFHELISTSVNLKTHMKAAIFYLFEGSPDRIRKLFKSVAHSDSVAFEEYIRRRDMNRQNITHPFFRDNSKKASILDLARRVELFSFLAPNRDRHICNPKWISRSTRLAYTLQKGINQKNVGDLTGIEFEEAIAQECEYCGYRVERRIGSRDGDLLLLHDPKGSKMSHILEVKHLSRRVTVSAVRQFASLKQESNAQHATIISLSGFTKDALIKSQFHGVELVEYDKFQDWLLDRRNTAYKIA